MNGELLEENKKQEASADSHEPIPDQYDMDDPDPLPERPLREAIEICREIIHPVYHVADRKAVLHQKYHRRLTIIAAVCGATSVLFAIIQLSRLFRSSWPLWIEIPAVLLALIAVVLGVRLRLHPNWLLYRHMAERCRLLKFQFLVSPETWCDKNPQAEKWREKLQHEIDVIKNLTHKSLSNWVKTLVGFAPPSSRPCVFEKKELEPLITYYRKKRLNVQGDFFLKRSEQFVKVNRYVGKLPATCFFISVAAALVHFLIDILYTSVPDLHVISVVFIVLAAFLPLLGATFRTLSTANEFARNASLYQARYSVLQALGKKLEGAQDKKSTLVTLWDIERLLESEHQEWLRLMLAADWY